MHIDIAMSLSLLLLIIGSGYLSIAISRVLVAERLLIGYLFLMLQILCAGYLTSQLGHFNDSNYWLAASVILTALVSVGAWRFQTIGKIASSIETSAEPDAVQPTDLKKSQGFLLVVVLGITVALVAIANLFTAVLSAPHNIDSHTCHLARTAHFLQQGSLNWYPTNMWAQVSHPRNHPVLLAYAWKLGGQNATQLVNFSAWLISGVCVFGIVFNLLQDRLVAWVSALLTLLLVNGMLIATTTQNDMIVAVQSGTAIYLMSAWYRAGSRRYLWLLALPLFIGLGVKASVVLLIPALMVVALASIISRKMQFSESFFIPCMIVAATVLIGVVAAIPTGYLQNVFRYGHPLGVEHVRTRHTLEGLPRNTQFAETGKNALRYAIDSTSFDGVKRDSKIDELRNSGVAAVGRLLETFDCRLEQNDHSKQKFFLRRPFRNHEDFSWWGVAGMLLIWPSVAYSFYSARKNRIVFIYALAFVVFLMCQGYAQYDPWRGRYFTWATPMVMVPVALLISALLKHRMGQTFLMLAVVVVCLTSGRALLYRTNSFLVDKGQQKSIFAMDRIDQICRNTPQLADVIRAFEKEVTEPAAIAVAITGKDYLYPYYGDRHQHTISYVHPNAQAVNEASGSYDFLIFTDEGGKLIPAANDVLLGSLPSGADAYLRRAENK